MAMSRISEGHGPLVRMRRASLSARTVLLRNLVSWNFATMMEDMAILIMNR
jgi:hypothetical protein